MQSATEREEQKEGQGKRKKQALPPAFTKLCSRELMLQRIAEAGGTEGADSKEGVVQTWDGYCKRGWL